MIKLTDLLTEGLGPSSSMIKKIEDFLKKELKVSNVKGKKYSQGRARQGYTFYPEGTKNGLYIDQAYDGIWNIYTVGANGFPINNHWEIKKYEDDIEDEATALNAAFDVIKKFGKTLKESVNEAKNDDKYVVIDFHEKGGGFVMIRPSSKKDAEDSARSIRKGSDISKREVLKVSDARKIRGLVGKEYLKESVNENLRSGDVSKLQKGLERILGTNVSYDINSNDAYEFYIDNAEFYIGVGDGEELGTKFAFDIYNDGATKTLASGTSDNLNDIIKQVLTAAKKHKNSLLKTTK